MIKRGCGKDLNAKWNCHVLGASTGKLPAARSQRRVAKRGAGYGGGCLAVLVGEGESDLNNAQEVDVHLDHCIPAVRSVMQARDSER